MMGINALEFGFLNFAPAGGHRLPRDRGALHPLRRLRRQLPEQAIRIVDRGASACSPTAGRSQPPEARTLPACGAVLGPQRYLEFLQKRTQAVSPVVGRPGFVP